MIFRDGKGDGGSSGGGVSGGELVDILSSSQESLLQKLGGMIAERLRGLGGVRTAHEIAEGEVENQESLKSIAKAMSSKADVDGTNFKDLGKTYNVEADKGKGDKTLDLLKNLP
jgi:hypothetical protein